MAKERVGYRRLYDSIGCSLSNREELEIRIVIGEYDVVVYIGNQPRRGIVTTSNTGRYVFPGGVSPIGEWKYFKNATESNYPRNFFTEIQCIKTIDISDDLSDKFHNDKKSGAHNELINLAEKDIEDFLKTADLVAGIIGLRFHRQFVLELINENLFVIKNEENWSYRITGSWLEMLEELHLNPTGIQALEKTLNDIQKAPSEAHAFASSLFRWILRAWSERDGVSKFLALFTPLEMALGQISNEEIVDAQQKIKFNKIKELISQSNEEDKEQLLVYFDYIGNLQKPSITNRFEILAKEAKLNGYEADIIAFRKFNRIRNSLLHRGDPKIKLTISVGEEETQQLGDLVERYVSWVLFRDNAVYQTRWRSKKQS